MKSYVLNYVLNYGNELGIVYSMDNFIECKILLYLAWSPISSWYQEFYYFQSGMQHVIVS